MPDIAIDTDVASRLQSRTEPAWVRDRVVGTRTWLTFVTVGELYKWGQARSWGAARRARLETWMQGLPVIAYEREVARLWGQLAGNAQRRGRTRPQNDTWIAACCIRHDIPLLTLNSRDFADFADHEGLILLDERT